MNDHEKLLKLTELAVDFKEDLLIACREKIQSWLQRKDLSGDYEEWTEIVSSNVIASLLYALIEIVFIIHKDINEEETKIIIDRFFRPTYRFINKMRKKQQKYKEEQVK
jgi:hypothetical protein